MWCAPWSSGGDYLVEVVGLTHGDTRLYGGGGEGVACDIGGEDPFSTLLGMVAVVEGTHPGGELSLLG
jgi:hypothetical protein